MKTMTVLIARIYITESSHLLKPIIDYLKNEVKLKGFSVFRAISGFGQSGNHQTSLLDISLDLPLAIEFFDDKAKVEAAIEHLNKIIDSAHIIYWEAQASI